MLNKMFSIIRSESVVNCRHTTDTDKYCIDWYDVQYDTLEIALCPAWAHGAENLKILRRYACRENHNFLEIYLVSYTF